jgi:hypothetical protein
MQARSYEEIFQEKFKALSAAHAQLRAWQVRLELKRLHPGLFQAVFGQSRHERYMGAVDFHLAEGHSEEEARQLVVEHAPELAGELEAELAPGE